MWRLPYKAAVLFCDKNGGISGDLDNGKQPASEAGDLRRVGAEFAGRVRRVTDIQWHGKVLYEYESIRTDDLGNSRN